jgi:DNA-binding NtrC family response regulator
MFEFRQNDVLLNSIANNIQGGIAVFPQDRPKLLVVDDERSIANTLAAIFQNKGYAVASRYCASDGIAAAKSMRPHLLVSDVMLPDLNGVQLGIQVRGVVPDCKVVLMSGDPNASALVRQARKRGHVLEFLEKPVDPEVLLEKVKNWLGCSSIWKNSLQAPPGEAERAAELC